jgi:hypothetical protein
MTHDLQTALHQGRNAYQQASAHVQATIVDVADRRRVGFLPLE